ncbi:UPF0182 family protein [Vallicoccus soli]|uniref:UPF0182 protein D5H78_03955 n=1 Tax=Vallicoccus soli TaxID=2339232 RepID=A0A3A3Z3V4_9ACTN|nr:UPF0182 family protein [Vallicoccus soli]RJK98094.1 UPF0182 family protein [Vallicoccus soli]
MSFQMPPDPGGPARRPGGPVLARRRNRALLPTLVVVAALVALFGLFVSYYTDYLWYQDVGFTGVFTRELLTRALLFLVGAAVMAGAVVGSFVLAYRSRPVYAPMSPEQQNLERYRQGIEPFRRLLVVVAAVLVGLVAGSTAAGQWQTFLLWRHGTSFGQEDAQFGMDISFFTFDLPWWRFVLSFAFALVIVSLVVAAATHYLYGGLRLQSPGERTSTGARIHLSVLLGVFVLLKAVAYWMDRWFLATTGGRVNNRDFVGLTFADVNAVLPAKAILAVISVIVAVLFFVGVARSGWLLPGLGVGLLLVAAVLIGSVYPAVVQRFEVRPSELDKESPYIERNIAGTRSAYDIADTEVTAIQGSTTATQAQLREAADSIPGIRLLDPQIVPPAFRQLQQVRGFYSFPDVLDVDRYTIDGTEQDSVVSVRELDLDGLGENQRGWINDHIVYTHGFGFVAARGNTAQADGRPSFLESDIPPTGELGEYEPRIYFGERSPEYSIVGAPEGSDPREFDRPDDEASEGSVFTTYDGSGGVEVGSLFRKLLYAAKYQEGNILLSDFINDESKILYVREPRDRVEKVAPWLKLDGNTYPAVVDGRIQWILDGYTTSNSYPYSSRTSLQDATTDALTSTSTTRVVQANEQVNYIRNSVKATVDAYSGEVRLYEWTPEGQTVDPVLSTWMKAFPGTVEPYEEIDEGLRQHLRYPEDLFKVQRELLTRYHVTDPEAFFSGVDFWEVPNDPTPESTGNVQQPPFYLTLRMPEQEQPAFSLTTTFVPNNRANLSAFAAVNAEPGEDYGTIRILELPRNTAIPGPQQVQNNYQANSSVAQTLNLLQQRGSRVSFGNLLTLPVGEALLYVEPVYVSGSTGTSSYPLLQYVLVAFGDRVGFAPTLEGALNQVFEGAGGITDEVPPTEGGGEQEPADQQARLARALSQAEAAIAAGEEALQAGDFAAYGEAQERVARAIREAAAAQAAITGAQAPEAPAQGDGAVPPDGDAPAPAATPAAGGEAAPAPEQTPSGGR